jgi:hypothetical protein
MSDSIQFEATAVDYVPNALHQQFTDGVAMWDATVLRLTAPSDYAGRELVVYHDAPPPDDSPWRARDRKLRFTADPDLFVDDALVFAAALGEAALV